MAGVKKEDRVYLQNGSYLRRWRKEKNISQRQLIEMTNLDRSTIQYIESGHSKYMSKDTAKKITNALGIEIEQLQQPPLADSESEERFTYNDALKQLDDEVIAALQQLEKYDKDIRDKYVKALYAAFVLHESTQNMLNKIEVELKKDSHERHSSSIDLLNERSSCWNLTSSLGRKTTKLHVETIYGSKKQ